MGSGTLEEGEALLKTSPRSQQVFQQGSTEQVAPILQLQLNLHKEGFICCSLLFLVLALFVYVSKSGSEAFEIVGAAIVGNHQSGFDASPTNSSRNQQGQEAVFGTQQGGGGDKVKQQESELKGEEARSNGKDEKSEEERKWQAAVKKIFQEEAEYLNKIYPSLKWNEIVPSWVDAAVKRRAAIPPGPHPLDLTKRYMFYKLGNDYGAGLAHYRRSLTGMLKEARKLGRVLIWLPMVLPPGHNMGLLEIKDPKMFFDKERASRELGVELIEEADFLGRFRRSEADGAQIPWETVGVWEDVHMAGLLDKDATVLQRTYAGHWDKYVFALNSDPDQGKGNLFFAPHLEALASAMVAELGPNYACVHVRRGDKASNKQKWPNLDFDTQPEQLATKIPLYVEKGRVLFIATNERQPGFFDNLKEMYTVKMTDDFSHLVAEGSAWHNASIELAGPDPPPTFDGYQRGMVDYHICGTAKTHVETFNQLTRDPWNGN